MHVTENNLVAKVKAWLLTKKPEMQDITLDFDLIENRVIDSLSFIEFLFFLEELSGRELQTEAQSVNLFRSLRTIQDNILNRP